MRSLTLIACTFFLTCTIGCTRTHETRLPDPPVAGRADVLDPGDRGDAAPPTPRPQRFCPPEPQPRVVEIREADPEANPNHHKLMRDRLIAAVAVPNTTVLLGPNVVLDFTTASDEEVPLEFGPCVTLASTSVFPPDTNAPLALAASTGALGGTSLLQEVPARTPHSRGPLLRFGPHRSDDEKVFLSIRCIADHQPNDHVRISGFRLQGPALGHQRHDDIGIHIVRCLDIEVSNMEIFGWGGQGIMVLDDPEQGPGQEPPNNRPGERIGRPEQVRVFGSFFHHNQHPRTTWDSHTAGYGVETNHGAWARITENVFDFNRHAIAAAGDAGGYEARRNLVLKGGGLHYTDPVFGTQWHTHQFDIHGTGGSGKGGQASVQTWYSHNAFQYLKDNAIYIRGRPHIQIVIRDNIFAHEGLEDDWGDDAIKLQDRDDLDVIKLGPNNSIEYDPYGHYGVCDFDGDGIDDLFLATGRSWWFSSFGEFHWSYLSQRNERLEQVRLGYFDDDRLCDVLTESGREWVISSAGKGPWTSIGAFGAPLAEVVFGRFDPNIRDHRPEATRRTTHAFRRVPNGEWLVTPLTAANWHHAQSSSIPLSRLRFGDFTGDGVTDVLAVVNGRWAISASAHSPWRRLNQHLSDDVRRLLFADLNHDNIDDIIKLERTVFPVGLTMVGERFTWWVSDNGRSRWRQLRKYDTTYAPIGTVLAHPARAFAGRFGVAPGGGVLLIRHDRIGRFFSKAEEATGTSPDWTSLYAF
jgi:hypothetical protein